MDLATHARRHPGLLFQTALEEMQRFLSTRGEAAGLVGTGEAGRFVTYLTTVFAARFPEKEIGRMQMREMRTLAEALDSLVAGYLSWTCDLLVQRFKALEVAATPRGYSMGEHHKLIPRDDVGLASDAEKTMVMRRQQVAVKLKEISGQAG